MVRIPIILVFGAHGVKAWLTLHSSQTTPSYHQGRLPGAESALFFQINGDFNR